MGGDSLQCSPKKSVSKEQQGLGTKQSVGQEERHPKIHQELPRAQSKKALTTTSIPWLPFMKTIGG